MAVSVMPVSPGQNRMACPVRTISLPRGQSRGKRVASECLRLSIHQVPWSNRQHEPCHPPRVFHATLQVANSSNGVASVTTPVSQSGAYVVKVVNLNLGPVQVWTAATPTVPS